MVETHDKLIHYSKVLFHDEGTTIDELRKILHSNRVSYEITEQLIHGENDVLRDVGEAYALKLLEAGVQVAAVRYHGTIHDFVMLNVIADDAAPRAAIEQASIMLKKILSD
jgi:hypothetical protein